MTEQLGFDFGPPRATGGGAEPADGPPDAPVPSAFRSEAELRPSLLDALAAESRAHPRERKLLVARTRGEARELLRQLALAEGRWIGFEVTTPLPMAIELAGPALARERLRLADEFEQQSLLDEAIDATLLEGEQGPLRALAEGVGFRAALRGAVQSLRLGGVNVARIGATRLEDTRKKAAVGGVLERYEALLSSRRLVDEAAVLRRAVTAVKDGRERPLGGVDRVYVLPGLALRGLPGRLTRALLDRGAVALEADPVVGLTPPPSIHWSAGEARSAGSFLHAPDPAPRSAAHVEVFSAASVPDELREVLRRTMERGLSWDQVEIVTPDPATYGSALHVLAESLGIPVSFGVGLPVERTRPGRAVRAYFRWIEGGFGADLIRTLLASGDLAPPKAHRALTPATLARRLRSLRIGWGRDRYRRRITRALDAVEATRPRRHESPEQMERRRERTRRELGALRSILFPVLRDTPEIPGGARPDAVRVSPAQLARGLRTFLSRVPPADSVDETGLERLLRRLTRIERTLTRPTTYLAAAAIVRGHLALRVPAPRTEGKAPWSSAGGHLFLTDLEHGGMTGRPATFVVGMDAVRFPGAGYQDPLLLDQERWTLAKGDLASSSDRLKEATFRFAALIARLRGGVTLSFAAWDPAEARVVPPAVEILLAHRLARGDPLATFEDLHRHLGDSIGAIPRGGGRLDGRDVWLGSLERDGSLLDGMAVVREAFPELDAGLQAREGREAVTPNAFHGVLRPRPERFDPRLDPEAVMSASRLETLGRCPRKYLFQSVIRVWIPDDPQHDPERWLDPLQRGELLHRVFERALREARQAGEGPDRLHGRVLSVLDVEARRTAAEVPSPSEVVFSKELAELRADAVAFAEMEGARMQDWVELEYRFGLGDDPPVTLDLAGGSLRLRGAIDRIDRTAEGLAVTDYKTGKVWGFGPETGAFQGGRRLQSYLYSQVVGERFAEPVVQVHYAFPTERGQMDRKSFAPLQLASGGDLISHLLDQAAAGRFVPTDDASDCGLCDFRELCGVTVGRDGAESPLAEWSAEAVSVRPELQGLKKTRGWEG